MADTSRPHAPKSGTPGNTPNLSTARPAAAELLPAGAQTLGELHSGPSAPRGLDAAQVQKALAALQDLIESIGIVQRQGRAMCAGLVALLPADVLQHPALAANPDSARLAGTELRNTLNAAQVLAGESLARLFDDLDNWVICQIEDLADTLKASAGGAA
jgi:hypothetical protein